MRQDKRLEKRLAAQLSLDHGRHQRRGLWPLMVSGVALRTPSNIALVASPIHYVMCRAASSGAGDSAESCWGEIFFLSNFFFHVKNKTGLSSETRCSDVFLIRFVFRTKQTVLRFVTGNDRAWAEAP